MRTLNLLVAGTAGVLTLGIAAPASADITPATVTVTGGALALSSSTVSANLGSRANTVAGGVISGSLGQVQVTDTRGLGDSGWVATVISSAFTPPAGPAIAASAVGYTAGTITPTGIATTVANNPTNLTAVSPAVTSSGTADNSATWNPTINVTVPGGMAAAVYSATITHSLA